MKMKLIALLSGVLSLGVAGAASAADMAVKAPPPPPLPVFSWTGCYIGGTLGGAWERRSANEFTIPAGFNAGPTAVSRDNGGVAGGAYVGCNYQFATNWVIGVEGDITAMGLTNSAFALNTFANGTPVGSGGVAFSESMRWLASARGRLGYAVQPNVLLYVTGGGAWLNSDFSGTHAYVSGCPNCSNTSFNSTRSGWVAGGGVEWAANNNLIFRAEGLYYRMDGVNSLGIQQSNGATTTAWSWNRADVFEGRVGISYKFGAPSAVVAKY